MGESFKITFKIKSDADLSDWVCLPYCNRYPPQSHDTQHDQRHC